VIFDHDGREKQVLGREAGLIADHVTDVALYGDGMALATPAGITFLDRSGAHSIYAFQGLVNNHVYALGANGDKLVAGTLGGLSLLAGGEVRKNLSTATSGLKHNWITALAAVGNEWLVGTYGAGVMRLTADGSVTPTEATRSFLTAGPRHLNFDFCDTTHCQFLKSPPAATSRVTSAVQATQWLVLAYRGKSLAAMYTSRCGGQTRTLRDVGLRDMGMAPGEAYPYYAVPCQWCRQHPATWQSRIGASGEPPRPGNERSRITAARQWGWGAIPGSDFTATADNAGWRLEGHSVGHGVGMCQMGATGMAKVGAGFREILSHYYPNTELITLP
jgi:hypothetical protein